MLNASTLYAQAQGALERADEKGKWHRCYFCGSTCGAMVLRGSMEASIRGKAITIDGQKQAEPPVVSCPSSPYACLGCKLSIRGSVTVDTLIRPLTGVAVRDFSWVISLNEKNEMKAIAHPVTVGVRVLPKDALREVCLSPPDKKPFAIVLSEMQADFMYRTPANEKGENIILTLNGDVIEYQPAVLKERLELAGRVGAALYTLRDKLAADLPPETKQIIVMEAIEQRYKNGRELLNSWYKCRHDPASRLAVWLSPSDRECETNYPAEVVPVKAKKEKAVK